MSNIKFNTNLFLGRQELSRFQQFLAEDGYKKLFQNVTAEYGFLRFAGDTQFVSMKVVTGTSPNKISIRTGFLVDANINLVTVPEILLDEFTIPQNGNTYYVVVSYATTAREIGTVNIDANGAITGTNTAFTDYLRGAPYHAVKVRFPDSSVNTEEYEILQVTSDTAAILNVPTGVLTSESDQAIEVIGTFSPGTDQTTSEKFPYQFDHHLIELTTSPPGPSEDGLTKFCLASVVNTSGTAEITDKRGNYIFEFGRGSGDIDYEGSTLPTVEAAYWSGEYSDLNGSMIQLGWGFEAASSQWSADDSNSIITVTGGSGGTISSTSDVSNNYFNGWRVYFGNGRWTTVITTFLSGSDFILGVQDVSIRDDDEPITIVPPADLILVRAVKAGVGGSDSNSLAREFLFPLFMAHGKFFLPYNEDGYSISYQLIDTFKGATTQEWNINGHQYPNELSWDNDGSQGTLATVLSDVVASVIELNLNTDNYRDQKAWRNKVNKFTATQEFSVGVEVENNGGIITLGTDGNSFLIDTNNTPTLRGISQKTNGTEIILRPKEDLTLSTDPLTQQEVNAGNLKILLPNNQNLFVGADETVMLVQFSDGWKVVAIPAKLQTPVTNPPVGGIMMWSGSYTGTFDSTGLGIGDLVGWALCNGNNTTPDLRGRFVVGAINQVPSSGAPNLAPEVDPSSGNPNYNIGDSGGLYQIGLAKANIPPHTHGPGTLSITGGDHIHDSWVTDVIGDGGTGFRAAGVGDTGTNNPEGTGGSWPVTRTSGGNDGGHTHPSNEFSGATENGAADDLQGTPFDNRPPFYALAYIMRVS
jgi:hypothetical protein